MKLHGGKIGGSMGDETLVNPFTAQHGTYQPLAEHGEDRHTLINRGGTAIDRWLNESPSKLFHDPEKRAIRYCRGLWQMIDKKGPPDLSHVRTTLWEGQREHEALAELSTIKNRFPVRMWNCFENICRFEMDAPTSAKDMASNARSANDAAKMCVAMVAAMIAQWKGL